MADGADLMGLKRRNDDPKLFSFPPIVAVEEGEDFAAAFRNAGVEGGRLAAVFLAQQPHEGFKLSHDFRGAVRGAVVYYKDLAVGGGEILLEHADNRFFDEALVVIRVNQYADKRFSQVTSSTFGGGSRFGFCGVAPPWSFRRKQPSIPCASCGHHHRCR